MSIGWLGLGLCPTWTRPDRLGWEKFEPAIDLCGAFDWLDWVLSVLGAYQLVSSSLQGVEIWLDLLRSGQYSSISFEIWPRSHYICQDLVEISLYRRSFEFRLTGFSLEHEICDWKRDRHWVGLVLRFLRQSNQDLIESYRVFTLATCSRLNHHSDRAVIESEIVGLVGFFGLGVCWTALVSVLWFVWMSSSSILSLFWSSTTIASLGDNSLFG